MNEEIKEMQKIICDACECATGEDDFIPCNEICDYCKITAEALINAGYHKYESEFVKQEMNVADKKLIEFLMTNKDSELPLEEFLPEYIKGERR